VKIYSMTATFGKLENKTLTLKPGLNIIEAPNEWGKSTWCAFLVAMLYGIDTKERTTQTALADKEHYAPWSGSPMSGRIDLSWNGRDITIERSTKGRSIFGQFRAYETASGLEVSELDAANCGAMLLGVEKSVFMRAGFLRLTDLPVTQDESLRRRLNALVTTGDESGASDTLAQKLKDLKNTCKSNRANGLIPKAEAQRDELADKLESLSRLRQQIAQHVAQQKVLEEQKQMLENHAQALSYAENQAFAQKLTAAQIAAEEATAREQELEKTCSALPQPEQLEESLTQLHQLRERWEDAQMQLQMLSAAPTQPQTPEPFRTLSAVDAAGQASADQQVYAKACKSSKNWLLDALGIAVILIAVVLGIFVATYWVALALAGGIMVLASGNNRRRAKDTKTYLEQKYRPLMPEQWETAARQWAQAQSDYETAITQYQENRAQLEQQMSAAREQLQAATNGETFGAAEQKRKDDLEQYKILDAARREAQRCRETVQTLRTSYKDVQPPSQPDTLTYTQAQTDELLAQTGYQLRQQGIQLTQCQTKMELLGQEDTLHRQLTQVQQRLQALEDTYAALEIAQNTLAQASAELQRKFAPRISRRAQELFSKLTGGRYDRLSLTEDLSVNAGAQGENTLSGALWRSDGTVDQLYLALRLAVAEELTPDAPLVLDDALVRFDDQRLAAALQILGDCAKDKQVILFTCQSRETALAEGRNMQ